MHLRCSDAAHSRRRSCSPMSIACPICLDAIDGESSAVSLRCGHVYHEGCLARCRDRTCPQCRRPFRSRDVTRLHLAAGSGAEVAPTTREAPESRGERGAASDESIVHEWLPREDPRADGDRRRPRGRATRRRDSWEDHFQCSEDEDVDWRRGRGSRQQPISTEEVDVDELVSDMMRYTAVAVSGLAASQNALSVSRRSQADALSSVFGAWQSALPMLSTATALSAASLRSYSSRNPRSSSTITVTFPGLSASSISFSSNYHNSLSNTRSDECILM